MMAGIWPTYDLPWSVYNFYSPIYGFTKKGKHRTLLSLAEEMFINWFILRFGDLRQLILLILLGVYFLHLLTSLEWGNENSICGYMITFCYLKVQNKEIVISIPYDFYAGRSSLLGRNLWKTFVQKLLIHFIEIVFIFS